MKEQIKTHIKEGFLSVGGESKTLKSFNKTWKQRWLYGLNIRQKIACGYALAIGIAVLGTGAGILAGDSYQKQAINPRIFEEEPLLYDLKVSVLELSEKQYKLLFQFAGHTHKIEPAKIEIKKAEMRRGIDQLKADFARVKSWVGAEGLSEKERESAEMREFLRIYGGRLEANIQRLEALLERINTAGLQPDEFSPHAKAMLEFAGALEAVHLEDFQENLTQLIEKATEKEEEATALVIKAQFVRIEIVGASILLSVALAAILALRTSRAIARPLQIATSLARRVTAEGNFDLRVPVETLDEIGQLTNSLNQLIQCVAGSIEEIEESKAELDSFFNLSFDMLCIADLNGCFRRVNPAFEKTLGYSPEEFLFNPYFESIQPSDRAAICAEARKFFASGAAGFVENRYPCKDGSYKWLAWTYVPVIEKGLVYAVGRDMTPAKRAEEALKQLNEQLEMRVEERTAELNDTVRALQGEMAVRRQAEAALQKSEARLNGILNSLESVVRSVDATTFELLYLNPAAEKVYGRPPQEFLNSLSWLEAVHPEDRQGVERDFTVLFSTGRIETEYRIVLPALEVRWVHDQSNLVKDGSGTPVRIDSIVTDITRRKRAEEALRQYQEHLEERVAQRTVALTETNQQLQGEIAERKQAEEAQRRSEAQLRQKVQREELLYRLAGQIRQSLDLDTILETAAIQIRSLLQTDWCLFIWYLPEAQPPVWHVAHEAKNPDLPSLLGYYPADATGTVAQKLFNLEIYRIDDVAAISDPVERQFFQCLGYTSFLDVPVQTPSGAKGVIACAQHSGARSWLDSEVELLQAVCQQLALAISQAELYASAQNSARLATEKAGQLLLALEELKQTQAQLIQSEKMSSLGQMVAGLAHEINNPVNFIHGNLRHAHSYVQELLELALLYQEHCPNPIPELRAKLEEIDLAFLAEDLPKLLNSMRVGTERIRQLVLSLRNFSRLDEAEMKEVDLHSGLDSTLLILNHRLSGIEVIKEYGDLPLLECYPAGLNQVFMNILSNAIDALEMGHRASGIEGGEAVTQSPPRNGPSPAIWIRTEVGNGAWGIAPGASGMAHRALNSQSKIQNPKSPIPNPQSPIPKSHVAIVIGDNGPGISPAIQDKIFDPFFTTKPIGQGTGLGLSICYQMVEKHGGEIRVVSQPGEGTEFAVVVPVKQLPATAAGAS
ncbi:PAS domain-containing protein [Kamptonema formosum]|uniref:PAS domain-containing protein n=1 Tax=Kamptonema formosum TaxID=331992 RepID=UPI0003489667|nr:PAS domain-containing protein [Oscillatoria sp. PCC 10802]